MHHAGNAVESGGVKQRYLRNAFYLKHAIMIVGIGIDVIQNDRIKKSITKFGSRFINRIYTETEIGYCNNLANPVIHFARRRPGAAPQVYIRGTYMTSGGRYLEHPL